MALTNYTEYLDKLRENRTAEFFNGSSLGRGLRLSTVWHGFSPSPSTPTTSIVTDKNSAQSIGPIPNVSSGRLTFLGGRFSSMPLQATGSASANIMIDLLNISGGLNATLTTPQTTNLPTAALTRYTSGEGVMAGIIVFTQIGNSLTTIQVSYTNSTGTSGRTSTPTTFGQTGFRENNIFIPIPLQAGDTGVRSIESVTLAATTAGAGNFGVCLYKPLAMISLEDGTGQNPLDSVSSGCIIGSLCEIQADACLTFLATSPTSAQSISGAVILTEA